MINRRQFSALLSASLISWPVLAVDSSLNDSSLYISAASDRNDQHYVAGFSYENGIASIQFKHALPGRAHHVAVNAAMELFVVVARRPGRFLLVGDLRTGEIIQRLNVPEDRHLFGHGIFSKDGDYFYTLESDYKNSVGDNGRLVSWKVKRQNKLVEFERLQEFSSHGVGPHELLLMPDEKTLVIANGGIRTHPDSGREKLNLESMKPSLVYINRETGELLEQHWLEDEFHQASIRHLDVNAKGKVVLAMQYEGEPFDEVPLLATHQRGEKLQMLAVPLSVQQQMKQYVGSVRFDKGGRYVAASCPRGNMITFWDTDTGEYKDSVRSRDGCGICATENGFVLTAGTGRINHYDLKQNELLTLNNADKNAEGKVFWDNHLSFATL